MVRMNPKMKDIASRANVSVSTVSKIINKETKNFRKETVDRVQKIIKEMGYAPNIVARSMVTKKNRFNRINPAGYFKFIFC